jgi:asparagine synthase (glutamine-hydrolysing)
MALLDRPGADMRLITQRGLLARSRGREDAAVETWGLPAWDRDRDALLLAASARRHEQDLSAAEVAEMFRRDPAGLAEVLPTCAAAVATPTGGTTVATDYLGFRHVFHGQRAGTGVVSTSSHACAAELGSGLDLEAVAVQSSLGWQLDQRTLFEGVRKLAPGEIATVDDGAVTLTTSGGPGPAERWDLDDAVRAAARILRTYLAAYLEDHPDAGLQLTGGQDSRLLLSAVPPAQRRGLRAVTLGVAGDPDVDIAAALASRFGMRHELLSLSGLEDLDPAVAFELCLEAARRLDYSADPLAHAALSYAEARSEPGPRISGLGGEVARGFYYLGLPTRAPVSTRRAERLAHWRMFVNEGVPAEALSTSFGQWSRDFATSEVVRVLTETGRPWMAATDALYLHHRMQRWGGVTETAVCLDREVVNPMLDDRFISIATALSPLDKRSSRFLSRLQLELDTELGSIPLDGRPPPAAYAHRSVRNSAQQTATTLGKAGRKVAQRLRGHNRPPAGGELLAAKVVAHWRDNPALLDPLDGLAVFDKSWLDAMVTSEDAPASSAVALVVNLLGALQDR